MLRGEWLSLALVVVVVLGGACQEVCDDQADNDNDGFVDCADPACGLFPGCDAGCGDDVLDDDEACDDGNDVADDGCTACALDDCGDGVVGDGEACDDGNVSRGDGCDDRCQFDQCGNGRRGSAEECDDGNLISGDGCSARCKQEGGGLCGNGRFDEDEDCDDGNNTPGDGCGPTCRGEFCGDGVRQARLGEACDGDDVPDGELCSGCQILLCGNGRVDFGEVCDDGNFVFGDACSDCRPARCGNGIVELAEQCDDGNALRDDGCDADCVAEFCGDGVVQQNELCEGDGSGDVGCFDCLPRVVDDDLVVEVRRVFGFDFGLSGPVPSVVADEGRLFISSTDDGTTFLFGSVDDGLPFLNRFPSMSSMALGNLDGRARADLIGCDGALNLVVVTFTGDEANTQQTGTPCTAAAFADFDGNGLDTIVAARADTVSVQNGPFSEPVTFALEGGLAGPGALATVRDVDVDVVVVAAADGRLWELVGGPSLLLVEGRTGDQVLGADLDGDGNDELVSVNDGALSLGDRAAIAVGAGRIGGGDLDDDARDDVFVLDTDGDLTLLLSTRDFAPLLLSAPNLAAGVVVDGDLLVVAGRRPQPLSLLIYDVTRP